MNQPTAVRAGRISFSARGTFYIALCGLCTRFQTARGEIGVRSRRQNERSYAPKYGPGGVSALQPSNRGLRRHSGCTCVNSARTETNHRRIWRRQSPFPLRMRSSIQLTNEMAFRGPFVSRLQEQSETVAPERSPTVRVQIADDDFGSVSVTTWWTYIFGTAPQGITQ